MGRITKDDRCLITGLRTEKNWGAFVLLCVMWSHNKGGVGGRSSHLRAI